MSRPLDLAHGKPDLREALAVSVLTAAFVLELVENRFALRGDIHWMVLAGLTLLTGAAWTLYVLRRTRWLTLSAEARACLEAEVDWRNRAFRHLLMGLFGLLLTMLALIGRIAIPEELGKSRHTPVLWLGCLIAVAATTVTVRAGRDLWIWIRSR